MAEQDNSDEKVSAREVWLSPLSESDSTAVQQSKNDKKDSKPSDSFHQTAADPLSQLKGLANRAGKVILSLTDVSTFFRHCPAILAGLIMGLLIINWIDGLNDGAKTLIFIMSICAAELALQALKKPHNLVSMVIAIAAIGWIQSIAIGAKIIIVLAVIGISEICYKAYLKTAKKGAKLYAGR